MSKPLFGWYGDDFTGATDTLAVLAEAGLRAMLFLGVPTAAQLAAAARAAGGELQAVGIAGAARAMAPAPMEEELEPVGAFFAGTGAPVLHYKVCSTFDSAPEVGSIGTAVRVLRRHVPNPFVPIVGGQPSLGRYCAFSNLFAAAGRGGAVERIDRHPTMSRHPVTPMQEADLRLHLARQGLEPVAAVHYPAYADAASLEAALRAAAQAPAVLFDVVEPGHLAHVGRILWEQGQRAQLLAVGSSAVAQALVAHWRTSRVPESHAIPKAEGPVFVFAGSLSPVTARQVQAAHSFAEVALQAADVLDPAAAGRAQARIVEMLAAGRNVLAHTGTTTGAAGPGVAAASAHFVRAILRAMAEAGRPLRRVGIAGGDTSSLATQALGLWGLSCLGTLGAGVTVSRAHAEADWLDGMEIMLKGGQMGAADVFEELVRGSGPLQSALAGR